jgi:integrase
MKRRAEMPKKDMKNKEISVSRHKKESLTFEELQRVLSVCETLEDKALIELAVTTGIRREDIVNIELSNIDLERRTLTFWEEKKDRWWVVALEPEVAQTLQMFINQNPNRKLLFEFSGRTAYNRFQALLKKAGIKKHLAFHALRRTFIRLSKRMGRDIRFVMDQTGDTARVIIEEYEGYDVDELAEMMEKDGIMKRLDSKDNRLDR